ncbi:MAG: hypothetical protein ABIG93_02280 [archaeon]|nr:hypothetical protein [Nanoarchaeota archaeon]
MVKNKSEKTDVINIVKKIIQWTLFTIVALYVITGLEMTQFQLIEKITFGLLGKALSSRIHTNLLIPFLILLIGHMTTPLWYKLKKK